MAKGLPGIVWPPLNALGPAGIRELLSHFEDSQWLTPEALQARQFRQLGVLVEHARATVPFYRRRLAGTGVEPGGLDMEAWLAIPTLKRRELQEEGEALSSRRPLAKHGRASTVTTSGSTGMPVTVHRSALSGTFWHAVTARDHLWHGRDVGTKLAAIRVTENPKAHAPAGAHGRGWGRAARTLGPPGPVALIDIGRPVPQQLDWLRHEDPDYLITYPSNLAALLRESRAEGTRLVRLRQAMTISEALSPGLREACREVWGVEIADTYSNQEHGALALQCPEHTHYHVQSEAVLLEVLDEGGRPCGPGEVGRVVITPLHAFAMPLIRYEVGDYAEVGPLRPGPAGHRPGARAGAELPARTLGRGLLAQGGRDVLPPHRSDRAIPGRADELRARRDHLRRRAPADGRGGRRDPPQVPRPDRLSLRSRFPLRRGDPAQPRRQVRGRDLRDRGRSGELVVRPTQAWDRAYACSTARVGTNPNP
jgi:phenylacetate-CoA ligase